MFQNVVYFMIYQQSERLKTLIFRQHRSLSENESDDPSPEKKEEFLSLPVTANLCPTLPPSSNTLKSPTSLGGQRSRSVIKSFSATGLSLMIPPGLSKT